MTETEIKEIIQKQRSYFHTGATLPVEKRLEALKKLKVCIQKYEPLINEALKRDLGKSNFESYMCETGLVLSEISYMLKHIRRFSREKRVHTPLSQFHSRSFTKPGPYGVVLIMSPWNYPFLLSLDPLIDAIAAGNTVILKPSAYSPNTSKLIEKMIRECFSPEMVAVVTGGRAENTSLLEEHFDYIFFTGSQNVGREVMKKSSAHLTPVTLELGGKSPCIVDESADLKLAARRIVFGKYLNCGQTCVAPDYLMVHRKVQDKLTEYICDEITRQYGENPQQSPDYPRIVNARHFDRLSALLSHGTILCGGTSDPADRYMAPTLLTDIPLQSPLLTDEIFGPILPVLPFDNIDDCVEYVNDREKPLALYYFTRSKKRARYMIQHTTSGGACINDTIVQTANGNLPFGGIGNSGMGAYHGRESFETFSHCRSIVDSSLHLYPNFKFPPYADKLKWLKRLMK